MFKIEKQLNEQILENGHKWCQPGWDNLVKNYKMKQSKIVEFSDYLDWDLVCKHQKLSERFILNHSDKVNWTNIFMYQNVSDNFIKKNRDKFDKASLSVESRKLQRIANKYDSKKSLLLKPKHPAVEDVDIFSDDYMAEIFPDDIKTDD